MHMHSIRIGFCIAKLCIQCAVCVCIGTLISVLTPAKRTGLRQESTRMFIKIVNTKARTIRMFNMLQYNMEYFLISNSIAMQQSSVEVIQQGGLSHYQCKLSIPYHEGLIKKTPLGIHLGLLLQNYFCFSTCKQIA